MSSRRDAIFESIPPGYSGWLHLALTNALALSLIVPAACLLDHPSWRQLLTVPLTFLVANAGEWTVHRFLLHRPVPGLRALYQRHALTHHVAFTDGNMAAPTAREWRWVLFPTPAILGLAALVVPVALLLARLASRNVGLLWTITAVGFYLLYEWCHLAYHQPEDSAVSRSSLVRALRRHHQRHHEPSLERRANFNVTFPLVDWLAGTLAPRERATSRRASP